MCEDERFPNTTYISDNSLWLPIGSTTKPKEIDYICNKIKEFNKSNTKTSISVNRLVCC